MNYDTVSAAEFGASLKGLGLNLLVRDVLGTAAFLQDVFGMKVFQSKCGFRNHDVRRSSFSAAFRRHVPFTPFAIVVARSRPTRRRDRVAVVRH